jgi:hypothetical protein
LNQIHTIEEIIALYRLTFLDHAPKRQARMLTPQEQQQRTDHRKYTESATPITDAMIAAHLAGRATYAAPAAHAGLACLLSLDVDAGGAPALRALLDEATRRGWFAFVEYTPRPDRTEQEQRGYVHLPICELVSADRLQLLGFEIKQSVIQDDWKIDSRVQEAVTRLPLGMHQHTQRYAEIWLPTGEVLSADTDRASAFNTIITAWHTGPVEQLPQRPQPSSPQHAAIDQNATYSAADIQRLYNEAHDPCDLLQAAGGRRASRTGWHCPCGQHTHGDKDSSLLIKEANNPKYGRFIVQGYREGCIFYTPDRKVWDSFNIYRMLHHMTNTDMLLHARQELGIKPDPMYGNDSLQTRPYRSSSRESVSTRREQDSHQNGPYRSSSIESAPTAAPAAPKPPPAQPTDHHERRRDQAPQRLTPGDQADATTHQLIYVHLAQDDQPTPASRKVINVLLDIAGTRTWCRPSIAQLITRTGYSERTIQRSLRQLETIGYMQTDRSANIYGGDETSIYRLQVPQPTAAPSQPERRGGVIPCHPSIYIHESKTIDLSLACKGGADLDAEASTQRESEELASALLNPPKRCISAQVETVGDPDGAQYNPAWECETTGAPTGTGHGPWGGPKDWLTRHPDEHARWHRENVPAIPRQVEAAAPADQLQLDAEAMPAAAPAPRPAAAPAKPPRLPLWVDEATRKSYYGLLKKADRPGTSYKQGQLLRQRAVDLYARVIAAGPQATPLERLIDQAAPLDSSLELLPKTLPKTAPEQRPELPRRRTGTPCIARR